MRHLENPNRATVRELEDLLVAYGEAIDNQPVVKRQPRKVDPTRDPEDIIGDAIR
jgi:hypothetical protein